LLNGEIDGIAAAGILKLPFRLRRDLILLLALKLAMLALLYVLFFSPAHRPAIDVAAHIANPVRLDHQE
jgi:hypothetical protein